MKIQKQPNIWSCLPTAFAIALDVPVSEIIEAIGHDGSEIIWPQYIDPFRRRSFALQELTYLALRAGFACPVFEHSPLIAPNHGVEPLVIHHTVQLVYLMSKYQGVIIGKAKILNHAVAWDKAKIYDPCGSEYPITDNNFTPSIFIPVIKL